MSTCPNFHPDVQLQLTYAEGGRYGPYNCTACSGGMTGEGHTCGSLRYTGAQVRAASSEPIPDPESPGLNLAQVDTALYKLSGGRINLDTHYRYPMDSVRTRVDGGAIATLQIQRSVLVENGHAHGNNFRGAHAITIGSDSKGPWYIDPLTGFHRITWNLLGSAAAALVLGESGEICGRGKAYVSFTRDLVANYRISVQPFAGHAKRDFALYVVKAGVITARHVRETGGFTANSNPPRLYTWSGHTSQRISIVTSGFLAKEAATKKVQYGLPEKYARAA